MSKPAKFLLIIGILLTVLLLYIVGCAGLVPTGLMMGYLLFIPVFFVNANVIYAYLNWVTTLDLLVWIAWAIVFWRQERE